jgi:hypothetical protein
MFTYLLICEATRSEDRYSTLLRAIESNFECSRLGRFIWALESDMSAADLCDFISPHIKASDRLIIVRVTADLVWSGLPPNAANWLRRYAMKPIKR